METSSVNRPNIETPETPGLQRPDAEATSAGPKPQVEPEIPTPKPEIETMAAGPKPQKEVQDALDDVSTSGKSGESERGGLNLFKWMHKTSTTGVGWREGDNFLYLPDKGSSRANWKQNSGRLRQQMNEGRPIFDSYREPSGELIPTKGFLAAERNLLETRGWKYDPSTGAWHPPKADMSAATSTNTTSPSVTRPAGHRRAP